MPSSPFDLPELVHVVSSSDAAEVHEILAVSYHLNVCCLVTDALQELTLWRGILYHIHDLVVHNQKKPDNALLARIAELDVFLAQEAESLATVRRFRSDNAKVS